MTKDEILKKLKYLNKLCPQIKDCSLKCIGAKCKDDTCPLCEIEELIQKLGQFTPEVNLDEGKLIKLIDNHLVANLYTKWNDKKDLDLCERYPLEIAKSIISAYNKGEIVKEGLCTEGK